MNKILTKAKKKVSNIKKLGLSIYDNIEVGDKELWLTSDELEILLNSELKGLNLEGLPLRTRSKVVKSKICEALGYEIPKSFKKTQPRFSGQNFDTYTQKSNNLQVWNEDLNPLRRYVLLQINDTNILEKVKVISGSNLASFDTTGTLTQKYQARLQDIVDDFELVSESDTEYVTKYCSDKPIVNFSDDSPSDNPIKGEILPIDEIYKRMQSIVGKKFKDPGSDQERNRGAELHKLVCKVLGYNIYKDNGQFPDVRSQLLEIKLQTSPTVDLGLVSPDSKTPLDMEKINSSNIRHCDVRYAIFYAKIENGYVIIKNLIVTTGRDFFKRMPKFEGKGLNKKLQIPLPKNFFD